MKISAPGKLMLSGEWSVLEGKPCIILALDKKVSVEIEEKEELTINAPDFGISGVKTILKDDKVSLDASEEEKNILRLVSNATEVSLKYLKEKGIGIKTFELTTHSKETAVEVDGKREKLGFGSSAAITVATVGAILTFHEQGIATQGEKEIVYKLGVLAHYFAQGKVGSSFDVAISTFGGLTKYTKPDMNWVVYEAQKENILDLVEKDWPNFEIKNISVPKDILFSIGFTGKGSSTKELVIKMREFKEINSGEYWRIYNAISDTTKNIDFYINENNPKEILELIKRNRQLLNDLSKKSELPLETKELALLADLADEAGGAGKFSGAGGGDCGIAVSFDPGIKKKIEAKWKENGIFPVNVSISREGVKVV
jgi:phosphomevalonate kinase